MIWLYQNSLSLKYVRTLFKRYDWHKLVWPRDQNNIDIHWTLLLCTEKCMTCCSIWLTVWSLGLSLRHPPRVWHTLQVSLLLWALSLHHWDKSDLVSMGGHRGGVTGHQIIHTSNHMVLLQKGKESVDISSTVSLFFVYFIYHILFL